MIFNGGNVWLLIKFLNSLCYGLMLFLQNTFNMISHTVAVTRDASKLLKVSLFKSFSKALDDAFQEIKFTNFTLVSWFIDRSLVKSSTINV